MKVKFVFNQKWVKWFGVEAITLYPFVFCALSPERALNTFLLSHEIVHLQDIRTQGFFSFYWTYLISFAANFLKTKNYWYSYHNIPHEVKAYRQMYNDDLYELAKQVSETGQF